MVTNARSSRKGEGKPVVLLVEGEQAFVQGIKAGLTVDLNGVTVPGRRKLNYATAGPLGDLGNDTPHCCPRCGCPCRDRKAYQRHRKAYHAKDVKHGVSYSALGGTWRVTIDQSNTYLTSEEEAWAYWKENR